MSLTTFLENRRYKKMTAYWRDTGHIPLKVKFPLSINGMKMGSPIEDAMKFGKPDVIDTINDPDVIFEFRQSGLELEFKEDKLISATLVFKPINEYIEWTNGKPATVTISGLTTKSITLSDKFTLDELKNALGAPDEEEIDDEFDYDEYDDDDDDDYEYGPTLYYTRKGYELQFDFTHDNKLINLDIFESDQPEKQAGLNTCGSDDSKRNDPELNDSEWKECVSGSSSLKDPMDGDPIARQTDWNPANKDGTNSKTDNLVQPSSNRTEFEPSLTTKKVMGPILFIIGLGIITLFASAEPGIKIKTEDDLLPYFFSMCAFLLSIFFIWSHQKTKSLIDDAQMWPIVVGKVIMSDIKTIIETHDEDPGGRGSRYRKIKYYKPQVRYKYIVNGETFTSDQIAIVEPLRYKDITEATKLCKQFPSRSQVNVYYNPAQPAYAILDRSKKNNATTFFLTLAVFFGLVGFFILASLLF
jgi:hypothetical protein